MIEKPRYTVWSYMATDEEHRPYRRTVFFYAGSIVYDGGWLKASDNFWIVPTPNPWNEAS